MEDNRTARDRVDDWLAFHPGECALMFLMLLLGAIVGLLLLGGWLF